jgi:23S rRNA (uracil1939-C5)-methyltransferase
MEYSFSNVRYLTKEDMDVPDAEKNMNALGFHVAPSFFRVLDLKHCYLPPELSDAVRNEVRSYALEHSLEYYDLRAHTGFLRNMFVRSTTKGDWMLIMVFGREDKKQQVALLRHICSKFPELSSVMFVINQKKNDIISDLPVELFQGSPYITEELDGITYRIGPVSFFQTNSLQVLHLYRLVKEYAEIQKDDVVYDLYTGTGTIANFVAREAKKVVGIEFVESAVEDARVNSSLNGITNTSFFSGDLHKIMNDEFCEQHGYPDVLITDPPRSGMHEKVCTQILQVLPRRVVYVSCNAATQARDAALLSEKYIITKVQAVDMFPHTQHVESVMVLDRK